MSDWKELYRRAIDHHAAGRFSEARKIYLDILDLDDRNAKVLYLIGTVNLQLGKLSDSIKFFGRSIQLEPDNTAAINNRGVAFRELNQPLEALNAFNEAIKLNPNDAEFHNNQGTALQMLGRSDEAVEAFDTALGLHTKYYEALTNRGATLVDLGRVEEALIEFDKALTIKPDFPEAHYNRANALAALRYTQEALLSYDKAQKFKPNYVQAYWNKALTLLSCGKYKEGWNLYEWRLKRGGANKIYETFPVPSWRGQEGFSGKKLLVQSEQGFGDVVQFCRYLPLIEERGIKVVFEAPASLSTLLSTLQCDMDLVKKGDVLPHFDAYCPLMSLPYSFGTTIETIPEKNPYLSSDPVKVKAWKAKLGPPDNFRVGIAWSGTAGSGKLATRGLPLDTLTPIIRPSIQYHSLQLVYEEADKDTLKRCPDIQQHQENLTDFAETAALIECLDLVVTIDTSVAHVAGALGKPVWVLLAFDADYRWMLERMDSPWYPSARLFRQPTPGDWKSVVASVGDRLLLEESRFMKLRGINDD